jgi:ABC-2 type transport system permease protein
VSSFARTARALPTILRVYFSGSIVYRAGMVLWALATTMPLVMMALWTAVAHDAPVGRFGVLQFEAYFVGVLLVGHMTSSVVAWSIALDIRNGTLLPHLLRPLHPVLHYALENVALVPLKILVALPLVGAAIAWLGTSQFTRDPMLWLAAAGALTGAVALRFVVLSMIGALSFFWESSLAVHDLWLGFCMVFAGEMVPLSLFPRPWLQLAAWMPFRFTLAFPVEATLGLLTRSEALMGLYVQWAYVALFACGAVLTWRRGLAQFAVFGG